MSTFEVKINTSCGYTSIKCLDEKWKNFPISNLPPKVADNLMTVKNFSVRPHDIFLCGFLRSGTTRLQELVWIIANDFDFNTQMEFDSKARIPTLETPEWSFKLREKPFANSMQELLNPRVIKSHLPVQLLPDQIWTVKPKIIFNSRDPKDNVISFYHLLNTYSSVPLYLEEFLDKFISDDLVYTPYREYISNYLNLSQFENILCLTYEDTSADLDGTIQKVAHFLGKTVSTENVKLIKNYLKFENMKEKFGKDKISGNHEHDQKIAAQSLDPNSRNNRAFFRRGIVGGFKDEMPQEYVDRIDDWYSKAGSLNQGFNLRD
ncbi:unnamed protein product [Chironomus riparius]|uniref:Sulfotransferase domain-containing protein n=1 Tax=Chironomus riparius TaxID=315576 RepID=A0A9N9S398_9DIPT|nr:unnamed protein product [Chironomus riparius]